MTEQRESSNTPQMETNQEEMQGESGRKKPGFKTGAAIGAAAMAAVLLVGTVISVSTGLITIESSSAKTSAPVSEEAEAKLATLRGLIELNYYDSDKVTEEDIENGYCAGLLEALDDPYSKYYTADEYESYLLSSTRQYYGIGASLSQDKETMVVTVSYVYENTPAAEAGLQEGDVIVSVDDYDAQSMELTDLVDKIHGEEGTVVHIVTYREGETEYRELDITRASVNLPTVQSEILKDGIGYIRITKFGANTAEEFETEVANLESQGMQAMIIDVRANPGGVYGSVVKILDDILPEGTVVYTEDKYGNREDQVSSGDTFMEYPLAVLVDENSASASEILAGAVRDFQYGTLIGTTTYGKGCVQKTYELKDGSAIKLTVEKYFTPSGENIQDTGIAPDIEIEYEFLGTSEDEYGWELDNQIQKAVEVLEGELGNE